MAKEFNNRDVEKQPKDSYNKTNPEAGGGRAGRKTSPGSGTTETTHLMARALKKEEMTTRKTVRDDPPAKVGY